ncbi:MAG: hypothetical protein JNL40_08645 [Cyclobacteriaceae bacterium]|nr:hypothetical protein [Cyclobacteriaceae bacterium]
MATQTTEEVKAEMIRKLGPEFGSLLYSLYNEIVWITYKWTEFKELYGSKESRIDLMNEAASLFFYIVQRVLWDNLLLGVARITDPPTTNGKKNITLKSICPLVADNEFRIKIEASLKEILKESEFCRDWRNRWIAHMDYELVSNPQSAEPLKPATRDKLESILRRIHALYNSISAKYLDSTVAFEYTNSIAGSVSLLRRIESGIRFEKNVYTQKLRDEWTRDEFKSRV